MNYLLGKKCNEYVKQKATPSTSSYAKFIMLCGKARVEGVLDNRALTNDILANKRKDSYVIYSEEVFTIIEGDRDMDLLKFEELLVEISDGVILYLESFGSATELGAFSYLDTLAEKTLVFINKSYEKEQSFINDGPIARINNKSAGTENLGGVNYTRFLDNGNIDFGGANYEKIYNFCRDKTISFSNDKFNINNEDKLVSISPQLLVYFVIDIIYVFDFVPYDEVYNYLTYVLVQDCYKYKLIFESSNEFDVNKTMNYILDMLTNWGILNTHYSKKSNDKLLSINYKMLYEKKEIASTFGKILFRKNMYKDNSFVKLKIANRRRNIDNYGNMYESSALND